MAGRADTQRDPYDMPVRPTFVEFLTSFEKRIKLAIRTNIPATVVAFDPATSTVTVLVGNLTVVRVPDPSKPPTNVVALNPRRQEATLAPHMLKLISVEFPDGQAGGMTFPILPGDTGMLAITDRSLDAWLTKGAPTDPVMAWTHMLHDAVFRTGLRAKTTARGPVDMTATVIEGMTGIKLGAAAAEAVLKAETLIALMDTAIAAAIAAALPIVPTAGDGGTAAFTAFQVAWDLAKTTTKSTKSKVE